MLQHQTLAVINRGNQSGGADGAPPNHKVTHILHHSRASELRQVLGGPGGFGLVGVEHELADLWSGALGGFIKFDV